MKDVAQMIKDRSHAMSHIAWDYHLYPAAMGMLSAAQVVIYKKFT